MDFLTKEEESHVRTLFNSSSSSSEDEVPKLPPKKRKISPEYTPQAGPSTAKKPRGGKRPGAGRPRGKKLSFEKGSPGGKRKGAGRKKFKSSNFSFVCMGAQKQKYKLFDKVIKSEKFSGFLVSVEFGFSGNNPHLQGLCKTVDPCSLEEVRAIFASFNISGLNNLQVQPCRSVASMIKYVTKEDWMPKHFGYDEDKFNHLYKMKQIVMSQRILDRTSYAYLCLHPNMLKQLEMLHTSYWNKLIHAEDKLASSPFKDQQLQQIIRIAFKENPSKKGLWLYGRAGSCKSSSCINLFVEPYCFHASSKFPLTSYNGEKNIYMDDGTVDDFKRHRELILQLTSGYSAPLERKGAGISRVKLPGYFVITSNYAPPTEQEFLRRFVCIDVDNVETLMRPVVIENTMLPCTELIEPDVEVETVEETVEPGTCSRSRVFVH